MKKRIAAIMAVVTVVSSMTGCGAAKAPVATPSATPTSEVASTVEATTEAVTTEAISEAATEATTVSAEETAFVPEYKAITLNMSDSLSADDFIDGESEWYKKDITYSREDPDNKYMKIAREQGLSADVYPNAYVDITDDYFLMYFDGKDASGNDIPADYIDLGDDPVSYLGKSIHNDVTDAYCENIVGFNFTSDETNGKGMIQRVNDFHDGKEVYLIDLNGDGDIQMSEDVFSYLCQTYNEHPIKGLLIVSFGNLTGNDGELIRSSKL